MARPHNNTQQTMLLPLRTSVFHTLVLSAWASAAAAAGAGAGAGEHGTDACDSLAGTCAADAAHGRGRGRSLIQQNRTVVDDSEEVKQYPAGDPGAVRRYIAGSRGRRQSTPEKDTMSSTSMRLELYLAQKLTEIHRGLWGPLANFTDRLRVDIAKILDVPLPRIRVLSVRGDRLRLSMSLLSSSKDLEGLMDAVSQPSWARSAPRDVRRDFSDRDGDFRARDENADGYLDPDEFYNGEFKARDLNGDGVLDADEFRAAVDSRRGGATRAPIYPAVPIDRVVTPVRAQTIVDLEILPGDRPTDPTPRMLYARLSSMVRDPYRWGSLAGVIDGAQLRPAGVLDVSGAERAEEADLRGPSNGGWWLWWWWGTATEPVDRSAAAPPACSLGLAALCALLAA